MTETLRKGPRSTVYRSERGIEKRVHVDDPGLALCEQAALRFLDGCVAPRLIEASEDGRSLLLEDLGPLPDLEAGLRGEDPGAVLDALGRAYGELHRATRDREARWLELLGDVPGAELHDRAAEAARWREGATCLVRWLRELGEEPPAGLDRELDAVAHLHAEPGDWLGFTHGDPAPTNALFREEGVRLVDFEYAGYRHVLYDVSAFEALCPLESPLVERLRAAHRKASGRGGGDEDLHWACMVVYRSIALLSWLPAALLEEDRPWVDDWTGRRALLVAACRLARRAREQPSMSRLAAAGGALHGALRARWPELGAEPIPRWGA